MSTTTDNVLKILRVKLPGAVAAGINLALGETVAVLCRDVLQIAPPIDYTTDPATWMPDAIWQEHHSLVIDGTLARMYGEVGKPYSNQELANAHLELVKAGTVRARVNHASAPATSSDGYNRLMSNLRAQVPGMRDSAIQQSLFNVVDDLQRNVLQGAVPAHTDAPETWLTSDDYSRYFRLLLAGTLVQILTQPGKPWSDPQSAGLQQAIYNEQVTYARGDKASAPGPAPTERLMNSLTIRLPGAKSTVIHMELFNVIDEFCRETGAWNESIPITLDPLSKLYPFMPPDTELVQLLSVEHDSYNVAGSVYSNGALLMQDYPTERDLTYPMFLTMSLAPSLSESDPDMWLPVDMWAENFQLLLDGVCSRMMGQIGKPYSNAQMSMYHGRRFRNAMAVARTKVATSKVAGLTLWRFPRFV